MRISEVEPITIKYVDDEHDEVSAAAVMLCLFDDCEFSGEAPFWGAQPTPKPGVHNSRALGSPCK